MFGKHGLFARFFGWHPHKRPQNLLINERYQLLSELGRGGMGTVWLADDTLLGRQVAVKELRAPAGLTGADLRTQQDRAFREARNAARIKHANAVTLHDAIREDGVVYLVMELVAAPTLRELVERSGPLPAAQVAGCGLDLLAVLAAAHALGIVHRDVKPGNIMITADGHAKLSDFGIAHAVGDPRLTSGGDVMGTRAYIAPELFRNGPVTPAVDLWSLGATLYYAAAGYDPFARETPEATLYAVLLDDPPTPSGDPALTAAIMALLQRNPDRRIDGVAQVRTMLQQAAAPGSASPGDWWSAPPARPRPSWNPDATTGRNGQPPPRPSWNPDATTGQHRHPGRGSGKRASPLVGRQPRGRLAVLAAAVLAAAVAAIAVVVLPDHGHPSAASARPSASPTHTKPKPKPPPLPPTGPSSALSDGASSQGVTAIAFSSDGSVLATGDGDGATSLWDLNDPVHHQYVGAVSDADYCQEVPNCKGSSARGVNALAISDGTLATADQNGFIYQWNNAAAGLGQPDPVPPLLQDLDTTGGVRAVAYDDATGELATGDGNGHANVWTAGDSQTTITDPNSPPQSVTAVAFSPDGTILVIGDSAGTASLWHADDDEPYSEYYAPGALVTSLSFGGPDGELLAVGDINDDGLSGQTCVYQWKVTNRPFRCVPDDNAGVTAVAFRGNSADLAVGDRAGDVHMYNFAKPTAPMSLLRSPFVNPPSRGSYQHLTLEGVTALAFDPAGPSGDLAVADANGETYLWRMNWLP